MKKPSEKQRLWRERAFLLMRLTGMITELKFYINRNGVNTQEEKTALENTYIHLLNIINDFNHGSEVLGFNTKRNEKVYNTKGNPSFR